MFFYLVKYVNYYNKYSIFSSVYGIIILKHSFLIISGALLFIFHELFVSDPYAYLDPSSGTMAIQAILGVLVGAGIAIKIYWEKIKFRLSNKFMKPKDKN